MLSSILNGLDQPVPEFTADAHYTATVLPADFQVTVYSITIPHAAE